MNKATERASAGEVPAVIRKKIQDYQGRYRLMSIVEGTGQTLTVFLTLLTLNLLLDRFMILPKTFRLTLVTLTWVVTLHSRCLELACYR
jgi:hypothetical protein